MIPGVEQSLNILLPSIWWLSASGVCECGISSKHYSLYIFAPKPRKTPRLSGSCFHNYLCKFTGIFVPAETNLINFFLAAVKHFGRRCRSCGPISNPRILYGKHHELRKNKVQFSPRQSPRSERNVFKSWKAEVLWAVRTNERKCILVDDWLGPEGSKIYDSLEFGFESRM